MFGKENSIKLLAKLKLTELKEYETLCESRILHLHKILDTARFRIVSAVSVRNS